MGISPKTLKKAKSAFLSFLRLVPLTVTPRWFADVLSLCHANSRGTPSSFSNNFYKIPSPTKTDRRKSPQDYILCLLKATGVSGQYRVPKTTVWWQHGGQRLWNGCIREFPSIYFFNWFTLPYCLKCILKFHKINKEETPLKRSQCPSSPNQNPNKPYCSSLSQI